MKELVLEERKTDPQFASELEAYFSEYADMDEDDDVLWDEEDLPF